jgi:hypothetical protein
MTMKYFKRKNEYKASNVWFSAATISATSYNWWVFVKEYNGFVVFNFHNYSVTTRQHQHKVRFVMKKLGINIDLLVDQRQSLDRFRSFKELIDSEIARLSHQIAQNQAYCTKKGIRGTTKERLNNQNTNLWERITELHLLRNREDQLKERKSA